ncbi:hypothetical protein GCG21_15790 [Pseudactinotalea sp. HY160]|uniref:hypothetical protein n=1 Tax=Pseudactinotalea sp. HY160 TaxID=2654490 RepID=UPI00128D7E15|nr:hypothetical protein [Pseudactinotalea sp. HY160]MPV51443.1 hypothetical protein [Pseudactinotalea sp. HY160]
MDTGRTRTSWSRDAQHPDRSEWVDLAVQVGLDSLAAQREELGGMRTRAVAFAALSVTAAAFLAGSGLAGASRTMWFYVLSGLGTLGFVLVAILLILTLSPLFNFRFILDPAVLMRWMEGDSPAPSKRIAMRMLAKDTIPGMLNSNEASLSRIRTLYRAELAAAVITLGLWLAVVWLFA